MKKIISIVLCLSMASGLIACSKNDKSNEEIVTSTTITTESTLDEINAIKDIEVDENLLDVSITIPVDLVEEGMNQDTVDQTVAEKGYISGTYNDDGSITYVMTKAQHQEALNELTISIDNSLQEIIDSEDYPNIINITHNENYTEFTITYDADEVGLADAFTLVIYYYAGNMYGVFSGEKPDNVHVVFINNAGDIIKEANSKDMNT